MTFSLKSLPANCEEKFAILLLPNVVIEIIISLNKYNRIYRRRLWYDLLHAQAFVLSTVLQIVGRRPFAAISTNYFPLFPFKLSVI